MGNKKNIVIILAGVVVTVTVFAPLYFKFYLKRPTLAIKGDLEAHSRSKGYLHLRNNSSATVYLYSSDEIVSKIKEDISCAAPTAGLTVYRGHYRLILDSLDSSIDIGDREFVESTPHDGSLVIDKLDPNDPTNSFIVLYNYGSCNEETIGIFGYNPSKQSPVAYPFRDKAGLTSDFACLSPSGLHPIKPLEKSTSGNLITRCYSQMSGKFEEYEWRFVSDKGEFQEI